MYLWLLKKLSLTPPAKPTSSTPGWPSNAEDLILSLTFLKRSKVSKNRLTSLKTFFCSTSPKKDQIPFFSILNLTPCKKHIMNRLNLHVSSVGQAHGPLYFVKCMGVHSCSLASMPQISESNFSPCPTLWWLKGCIKQRRNLWWKKTHVLFSSAKKLTGLWSQWI